MTDINDALGAGNGDDREPAGRGFLSPDEIEERVALFRASLVRLDQDPAEAARIDMLITEANDVFGDDLTPFDDPPVTAPVRDDAQPEGRIVINGSHAQPRIEVDYSGHDSTSPGFSLVINGDHAEPHIHVSANQADEEAGQLNEEVEELQQAVASLQSRAGERPGRRAPRMRGPGPSALAAVFGLASAVIAIHSVAVVQVIVIILLAVVPVLGLAAVSAAIFSGRAARREAALSVLRLLLDRDPHPEGPPRAGRSGQHLALSGREGREVHR
jgi:hypothetical protein